jgi:Holliday junction resolvase RusA-like endonuclease
MNSFTFVVYGQPPSTNHLYVRVRGRWDKMAKAPGVEQYQNDVVLITRSARPSSFRPLGQIRLRYKFYLRTRIDADNALKALNDAIAKALDINDDRFLPCVEEKHVWKTEKDPRVEITIEDLWSPSSDQEVSTT